MPEVLMPTIVVERGLPKEVRATHADMTARGFTGKVVWDYRHGQIVGLEVTEKRRLSREAHVSRGT